MNEPSILIEPTFKTRVSDDGILEIRSQGSFVPELAQAIIRQVEDYIDICGVPAGILLDMRHSANLSIVRLSHLIDRLTDYEATLVAVLFDTDTQLQLAVLLHNTLNNHEQVAYFIEEDAARIFLAADFPQPANTRR
ncbi:MAG: hypothetical protein GX573_00040 [Chloroflexi bacterium]|nr:hypothetical protein [Chloroflexota bacterium]